jgi:V8-like Glu-specific endopeptidase
MKKKLLLTLILICTMSAFSQEKNSDRLVKSTVRIINQNFNDSLFVGTGFFFSYNPDVSWNSRIEAIVTNKHVVKNAKILKFSFRTEFPLDDKGSKNDSIRNYDLINPIDWIYNHPDPNVDLCIIFLKPIKDYFLKTHKEKLDISYFNKELIPNEKIIEQLTAIEDVIMIGYPEGIIEPKKLYPIVRRGITATPYQIDFNVKKDFLTDIFAIGGSSGSPVILYRNNGKLPYLLGVHYAGLNNNKLNLGLNTKSSQIIEIFDSYINLKLQDPKQREYLEEVKKGNKK